MLLLLYCLSQNPDFPQSVKPLMAQLKNSEQMLHFLNELSDFTKTFSTFSQAKKSETSKSEKCEKSEKSEKCDEPKQKPSASATAGIANDFIEQILQNYLSKQT